MRSTIKVIRSAFAPKSIRKRRKEWAENHRCTIDHRCVNDLSTTATETFNNCAGNSHCQYQTATGKVAKQIDWWSGWLTLVTNEMQRARQRDVINVVPCRMGQRPVLSPACHTAVNHPWITFTYNIRSDTETLAYTWSKWINECISLVGEVKQSRDICWAL